MAITYEDAKRYVAACGVGCSSIELCRAHQKVVDDYEANLKTQGNTKLTNKFVVTADTVPALKKANDAGISFAAMTDAELAKFAARNQLGPETLSLLLRLEKAEGSSSESTIVDLRNDLNYVNKVNEDLRVAVTKKQEQVYAGEAKLVNLTNELGKAQQKTIALQDLVATLGGTIAKLTK